MLIAILTPGLDSAFMCLSDFLNKSDDQTGLNLQQNSIMAVKAYETYVYNNC